MGKNGDVGITVNVRCPGFVLDKVTGKGRPGD